MELWYNGTVAHGYQNGSKWGFPTANVENIAPDFQCENGVYAVVVHFQSENHNAMMYVGTRPTLQMAEHTVEIHIFDFHTDIYGCPISFRIVKKVRPEQRFGSVDELITQLRKDEIEIRKILSNK